ncbi:hypothetical protein AB0958_31775 [Streptomyces sp. NPDC006655]|uniref:hypothetical protein n=1 Tax=Streptomyces sp. NPDC006655 TaxID=3156898 RepID=UPI003451611F
MRELIGRLEVADDATASALRVIDHFYVLEHGYCRSLYTSDPNGLLLEFALDAPGHRGLRREAPTDRARRTQVVARR